MRDLILLENNMKYTYFVYVMASINNNAIYIGITYDLRKRVLQHKYKIDENCFTAKYNCVKLVYYEKHYCANAAIAREKKLKRWNRDWKNALIEKSNPQWSDLFK